MVVLFEHFGFNILLLMRPKRLSNAQKTVWSRLWFDNGTRSGPIRKDAVINPQGRTGRRFATGARAQGGRLRVGTHRAGWKENQFETTSLGAFRLRSQRPGGRQSPCVGEIRPNERAEHR